MPNKLNSNDPINNLVSQVKNFLSGQNFDLCQYLLQSHANRKNRGASYCLKDTICTVDEYQEILKLVAPFQKKDYFDEYVAWLEKTALGDNLLSFLEFLAYKKHHRVKTFLKLAHESTPKPVYWHYFAASAVITASSGVYFSVHPNQLYQILDWTTHQAPKLALWLMDYVFLPINVPRVSLFIRFFTFAYTLRLILNNHVTDDAHKIKQIIKHFIENILIMVAQFLCYLNQGILTPEISSLFILASLSTAIFSAVDFYNLEKPAIQPAYPTNFIPFEELSDTELQTIKAHLNEKSDDYASIKALIANANQHLVLNEKDYADLKEAMKSLPLSITNKIDKASKKAEFILIVQQLEAQYYYERKLKQLRVELVSLILTLVGSTIVILSLLPLPYLNIFFIIFQFFVNQAKSAYFYQMEQNQAKQIQDKVSEEWTKFDKDDEIKSHDKSQEVIVKALAKFRSFASSNKKGQPSHPPETHELTHTAP